MLAWSVVVIKNAADLTAQMARVGGAFAPAEVKRRLTALGVELKPYGIKAARGDLGTDAGFTGGRRRGGGWRMKGGEVIPLEVDFTIEGNTLTMKRKGKSAGPWRVAESGRKAYAAGDKRSRGFGKTRKDGTRREKFSTVKGTVGAAKGFGTWTKAENEMQRAALRTMPKLTRAAVTNAFKGR